MASSVCISTRQRALVLHIFNHIIDVSTVRVKNTDTTSSAYHCADININAMLDFVDLYVYVHVISMGNVQAYLSFVFKSMSQ